MTRTTCRIQGCSARAHGRGLCRVHFDQARYLETTGRDPEAKAAAERERWIEAELSLGCVPDWASPHGTTSIFATDEERREAWEERRERLLEEYLKRPHLPGHRPAAWWEFEAERPAHLTDYPLDFEGTEDKHAEAIDAHEIEPIVWMAEHGHLTDQEIEELEERAQAAQPRVGTDAEHIGSGGVDRVDQRAVKLWGAVAEALER